MKRLLRILLGTCVLTLLLAAGASAGEPTDQVRQSVDKVLNILRNKELKRPERTQERRAAIRKIVDERFDFEDMAKRSLALHWRKRTPEEKKEFVMLYSDLLERAYIKKIENYTDEKVLYTGESVEGDYAVVRTKIVRKGVETPIDYRLLRKNTQWEVYDVIIEGVSLVNNYRKQFNQIINSRSYEELVRRLKSKKADEEFEAPK
ncbi:MAG: MlaC/ttg2D family ABC transporter substrate-binding protein [Nitrospirota bacterium]